MKAYFVDLDYENFLFDPNYSPNNSKNIAAIKEFEYVFFLVNKNPCILRNIKNYSENYLNKLRELNFYIPQLSPDIISYENWWGRRDNLVLEKKLNSKITSAEIGRKLNCGFEHGLVVTSLEEVNLHIANLPFKKYILKSPFSFSGIGHILFEKEQTPLIQFHQPYLLEPVYDRVFDLGITFEMQDANLTRMFIVENFNNAKGSFKGGMGAQSVEDFISIIQNKYQFNLKPHLEKYREIFDEYLKLGATNNVQIDSFVYRDEFDGSLKLYQLVEVNYRKTMGLVIQNLAEHFPAKYTEWRITHTSEFENQKDFLKLSPENNKFNSYLRLY